VNPHARFPQGCGWVSGCGWSSPVGLQARFAFGVFPCQTGRIWLIQNCRSRRLLAPNACPVLLPLRVICHLEKLPGANAPPRFIKAVPGATRREFGPVLSHPTTKTQPWRATGKRIHRNATPPLAGVVGSASKFAKDASGNGGLGEGKAGTRLTAKGTKGTDRRSRKSQVRNPKPEVARPAGV
jgi:hypothetical protein